MREPLAIAHDLTNVTLRCAQSWGWGRNCCRTVQPEIHQSRLSCARVRMQRAEKSERSRRAVLDAALYLCAHQGYRATTMRQVADRANVSTGNCYHHFPDKDAIFRALIDEYLEITE